MTRTKWYTHSRIRQTAVSSFGVKRDCRRKRRFTRDACISSIAWRAYFTHSLIFGRSKRLLAVKGGILRRVFHHVVPRGFSRGFGLVILRSQIVFSFLWLYFVGAGAGQSSSNKDEERGRTQESLMDQGKLHSLKLLLLDELLLHLPQLKDVGGVQAIPFMQVQFSCFLQPSISPQRSLVCR